MSNRTIFRTISTVLATAFFAWLVALLNLPYGNHLASVYFPEDKPENLFEVFFHSRASRFFSGLYTDYASLECNSHMVFWQEGVGLLRQNLDTGDWITAYVDFKQRRNNERAHPLILRMVASCPASGGGGEPPLSVAVLVGDSELVDALLKAKADPYFGYLSQRGNHICPIVVATTMRDLSVKKNLPQDVKKYEFMIQAMKRAGEELHGRKELTVCADLGTQE
ncbi:hypothetical protein ACT048_24915 [Ectopseudomonas khazarica]|uniref:hypothetical protein n=1 Tax=Ectopseudomonas khazarica TaxID=2502979 RepID=UPI0040343D44